MPRNIQFLFRLVFSLAVIILIFGSYTINAQITVTGNWRAEIKPNNSDKIDLSLERNPEKGGRKREERNYSFDELQGLSLEQVFGTSDATVNFRLIREAGTIECSGNFENGVGAGDFRFTANQRFIKAMRERGFDFEEIPVANDGDEPANTLFAATTLNLTAAFVDDLKLMNFGKLTVSNLLLARVVSLTSQYKREMDAVGFPNLEFTDLISGRMFNLNANYIQQIRSLGYRNENFQSLINMRTFNVTPEYIIEVRAEGLTDISAKELSEMKMYNIDGEFIRRAKAEMRDLNVKALIKRRLLEVGKLQNYHFSYQ